MPPKCCSDTWHFLNQNCICRKIGTEAHHCDLRSCYSHCPEEPGYQLLYPARSRTEFEDYPLVKSFFFTVGMQFLQQNMGVIYTKQGILSLTLGHTKPTAFTFKIAFGDSLVETIKGIPIKR